MAKTKVNTIYTVHNTFPIKFVQVTVRKYSLSSHWLHQTWPTPTTYSVFSQDQLPPFYFELLYWQFRQENLRFF